MYFEIHISGHFLLHNLFFLIGVDKMKVNHGRHLNQIHKDIVILQKHGVDHGCLVFGLDFLVVQVYYGVDVEGLDDFDFVKYDHVKLKTVTVNHAEDSSFVILLNFKGFDVGTFKFKLETGCVLFHVVDGDGVVGHG